MHEWKLCARTLVATAVAAALLQGAVLYVGAGGETGTLAQWQSRMGLVAGVSVLIALSYTLWPKQEPARPEPSVAERVAEVRRRVGR
ncbi:MAG TPA: hypothetical protein DEQ61_13740 [Streptomyces sp.]|nr:hypothetical protein [Streptomyces sp.]